ncbi:hypothetical protein [Flagellimonas sp. S3867]|uniref:hypothetical protein n=1 Tax=Flagellimonas sp. S3867 TaxID=2768063 RepID=UPI001683AFDD|nr:hypothetical protein [Flagellimonas sp. S3867]
MDAGLRKRHKYIWLLLTLVLSTLLIMVIKSLNFNPRVESSYASEEVADPIKEAKHDVMDVTVVKTVDAHVLELNVKQPIKSASSVIFTLDENQKIGQLEGIGTYTFQLENEISGIIIKDVIKNQEILKLEF